MLQFFDLIFLMPLFLIIFTTYGQGLAISIELLNIFVESVTLFKHFVAILKKERNLYIFIHERYIKLIKI